MANIEVKINKSGNIFKVQVAGTIDEDSDFSAYPLVGASQLEVNLGNIKSINSAGIREWVNWISTSAGATVSYIECPRLIIDQINMVQGFLPKGGKVMSFYVPYYSDSLKSEKQVLFVFGKEYDDKGLKALPAIQDETGTPMEIDVIEAKYFKFLSKIS